MNGPVVVDPPRVPIIVTIDGPAGTGKSSIARALARRLGLRVLDTGAMYRAAAAIVIDHDVPRDDIKAVCAKVEEADLHFDWTADPPTMLAWNKSMDERIRDADVNEFVSIIAAMSEVRRHMVRKQQLIARQYPYLVSEGRDQGSVVFPQADVKFYLTADVAVRAKRRAEQIREENDRIVDADELALTLTRRDEIDSGRADSPLRRPEGAIAIDTTRMSFDEVLERLTHDVLARKPDLARP